MKKIILSLFISVLFISKIVYPQTWIEQNSGVNTPLTCVSVIDPYNVWICGVQATLLKTTNGGTNWIDMSYHGIPTNFWLTNIFAIDINTVLAAGSWTTSNHIFLFRTSDGGQNWSMVFSQDTTLINGIWMTSSTQGLMVGNPVGGRWAIWKTSNGGLNWDSTGLYLPRTGSEIGYPNALCNYGNRFWFGTNNSRIYYTSNYGVNWIARSTAPEQNITAVYFNNYWFPYSGLAGGSNLIKSDDTGSTWSQMSSMGNGSFESFTAYPLPVYGLMIQQARYIRSDNKIYQSISGGSGWTIEYTAPSGIYTNMQQSRNNGTFTYAVRDNGGISKCSCIVASIRKISGNIPDKYVLHQNYPNPFNPSTDIEFELPKQSIVSMNIYDYTGKLIKNLLYNEVLTPGLFSVKFNPENISSGIYFYTFMTNEQTITKKMIYLK